MVLEGALDAALVSSEVHEPGLKLFKLRQDRLCFIVGSHHRQKFEGKDWYEVIQKIPLVTYLRETLMRSEVDRLCLQNGMHFKTLISVNSVETICSLVREGAGGAFVLRSLVQSDIAAKNLFVIDVPFALPKTGISLAVRSTNQGEVVLRTLKKWLDK